MLAIPAQIRRKLFADEGEKEVLRVSEEDEVHHRLLRCAQRNRGHRKHANASRQRQRHELVVNVIPILSHTPDAVERDLQR